MSRRTKAREAALQILYQLDLNPDVPPLTIMEQLRERLHDESLEQFAWHLYAGVIEFRPQIDGRLEEIAANWSLRRMAPTDRNVLRLGAFEILHGDTPPRVAVDEAVELAKRYGSNQSAQFVNGILDRLIPGGRGATLREKLTIEPEAPAPIVPPEGATLEAAEDNEDE